MDRHKTGSLSKRFTSSSQGQNPHVQDLLGTLSQEAFYGLLHLDQSKSYAFAACTSLISLHTYKLETRLLQAATCNHMLLCASCFLALDCLHHELVDRGRSAFDMQTCYIAGTLCGCVSVSQNMPNYTWPHMAVPMIPQIGRRSAKSCL